MREIDMVALAGLMHDIGKFGQRAECYKAKDGVYKKYDYKYTHAAYTAQILNEDQLVFNLGEETSDNAAMHHNPQNEDQWVIAAADRMASGFEREVFETYNALYDKEHFTKQRLWYLFDQNEERAERYFKITTLSPDAIFPEEGNAVTNEYDALWQQFEEEMKAVSAKGSASVDFFTIDYLMKKFTSFIPSSTSFKKGEFDAAKANIPLYEHGKSTAVFAAAIHALEVQGNTHIIDYYRDKSGDIEQEDLLMICGDFFGIQKFIFDSVPASKASKILRAKSAYVQILTRIIAFHIVERLGLSYLSIISTHAGKFEILGINTEDAKAKLELIQQELNDFFKKHYFGETGIGISFVPCCLADFIEKGRYKADLRKRIDEAVEAKKFQKFDLGECDPVLALNEGLDNQNLCELCSKRKVVEEYCPICTDFERIGRELAKQNYLSISQGSGQIHIFGDYWINFSDKPKRFDNAIVLYDISKEDQFRGYAKWELSSYVKKDSENKIEDFETLAKRSCGESETGIQAIMSLKADVDGMGNFIQDSTITESFSRFNFFARMVDYFFSSHASKIMEGKNLYTVFAGGDDLFVLGAWDEVLEYGGALREEFMKFAKGSNMTLSMGLVLTKPNKPINFVASMADDAEMKAKNFKPGQSAEEKEKNAIALFGEVVGWEDYLDMKEEFEEKVLPAAEKYPAQFGTAFWYRLLEFCNMAARVKKHNDIEATMWKSKLRYSFTRNVLETTKDESLLGVMGTLHGLIDTYDSSFKMILMEHIYKRRERG